MKKITVSAVQMVVDTGDVGHNMKRAGELIDRAFADGAELVIVPEFFTSGAAFSPKLLTASRPIDGEPKKLLMEKAKRHNGYVGGSFIASRGGDNYNTFVWANPDGTTQTHDKDQPTMWENCYYIGGDDDGVIETPLGPVGVALCWELVRSRTARRLLDRVDLLVGGSCWWTVPGWPFPARFWKKIHRSNLRDMKEIIPRMARTLGVPVVHAAHAGRFREKMPLMPGIPYPSYYLGETQIVDAGGGVLARLGAEEGEGVITAEIEVGRKENSLEIPDRFWIPDIHWFIRLIWTYQNIHGRAYYRRAKRSGRLKVG